MSSDYDRWNAWLLDRCFPPGRPGSAVYLEVHESLLEEGCDELGLSGSGSEPFVEAVQELGEGDAQEVFPTLDRAATSWRLRPSDAPPPFVAGLGFAVLAASEMRTDPGKRATAANYYFRLNQLLGLRRKGQPRGFQATRKMWIDLRAWLSENRRGNLVLRGLGGQRRYVDPVKSQCLVRTCDLEEFAGLLRRVHCIAGREVDPEDLAPFLARWLRGPGASSRLAAILGSEPAEEMVDLAAEALADRIEVWGSDSQDFTRVEAEAISIILQAEPHPHPTLRWKRARWALALLANAAAEAGSVPLEIGNQLLQAELDYFEPPRFVAGVDLQLGAEVLQGITRATVSGTSADIPLETPLWLELPPGSSRTDTWEPTNSLSVESEYQIVFRESEFDRLVETYGGMLQKGYEILSGSAEQWPGPGLYAICSARIERGDSLPESIAFSSARGRLRFSGGLKVARGTYLRGALPTVDSQEDGPVSVERESDDLAMVLEGHDLNEKDLGEGVYSVRQGAGVATIAVTSPRWGEIRVPEGRHARSNWQAALTKGRSRGALLVGSAPVQVLHLSPGKKVTLYRPKCSKINVPPDQGVAEILHTGELHCVVMRGWQRPEAPVPLHDVFSRSAQSEENYPDTTRVQCQADRLLLFLSARASGPMERVRGACSRLAEAQEPWHRVLQLYEAMGHVDVDWDTRRWFAAPPVLCQRATGVDEYFAVGARTIDFGGATLPGIDFVNAEQPGGKRHVAPRVIVFKGERPDIEKACESSRLQMPAGTPANQLLAHLRSVAEQEWWLGPSFYPPQRAVALEQWVPALMRWRPVDPESLAYRDADRRLLIRWQDVGMTKIVLMAGQSSRLVKDPSAAKWLVAPGDVSFLRYQEGDQALQIPRAMGLPRPQLRASVLASGHPPRSVGLLDQYDGFSLKTARLLAVRLKQQRSPGLW